MPKGDAVSEWERWLQLVPPDKLATVAELIGKHDASTPGGMSLLRLDLVKAVLRGELAPGIVEAITPLLRDMDSMMLLQLKSTGHASQHERVMVEMAREVREFVRVEPVYLTTSPGPDTIEAEPERVAIEVADEE